MHRTIHSTIIVAITTVFALGCSRDVAPGSAAAPGNAAAPASPAQTKEAPPPAGDACSLLTKQDAAAALGEAASGAKSLPDPSIAPPGAKASGCEYAGSGFHKVQVIIVGPLSDTSQYFFRQQHAKKGKEGPSGLGDDAWWSDDKHEELQVLKGATFFSVILQRSGDPTDAVKDLAKKAFDQLR